MYFLAVPEARSLRTGWQHRQALVRALSWLLTVRSQDLWWSEKYVLWWLFLQGYQSHHEGPIVMTSSTLNYLPKALPPNTTTLGGQGFLMWIWCGGHKHSVHNIKYDFNFFAIYFYCKWVCLVFFPQLFIILNTWKVERRKQQYTTAYIINCHICLLSLSIYLSSCLFVVQSLLWTSWSSTLSACIS